MRFLKVAFPALLVLVMTACNKDASVEPLDWSYEYFANTVDQWIIYDVDSVDYDDFNGIIDTINYQLMDVIESQFTSETGDLTNRIERYRRDSITQAWYLTDVYNSVLLDTRAELVEENIRFIKLIFPPKLGATWEGNSYISAEGDLAWLADWEYEYTAVDEGKSLGGLSFESTTTIKQVDNAENLLEYIFGEEVYARDVGMISKRLIHLERDNFTGDWTKGFVLQFTVDSYGR